MSPRPVYIILDETYPRAMIGQSSDMVAESLSIDRLQYDAAGSKILFCFSPLTYIWDIRIISS